MPKKIKPPMPAGPEADGHNLDESVVPRKPMTDTPEEPAEPTTEPGEGGEGTGEPGEGTSEPGEEGTGEPGEEGTGEGSEE